ncbi:MAG: alpha/beta hydrolase, partial [Bacilli bacterium]
MKKEVIIPGTPKLCATYQVPTSTSIEKKPAILLLNGSGPADRDGNIPKHKLHLNIYAYLDNFFSSLGFITLRYDKRGTGTSEGELQTAGMYDLVNDAERALQFLQQQPEVDADKIIVVGHSEGAILAPLLAQNNNIALIIQLCGAGVNLREALYFQNELLGKEIDAMTGLKGWLMRFIMGSEKHMKRHEKLIEKILQSGGQPIRHNFVKMKETLWMKEHFELDIWKAYEEIQHTNVLAVAADLDAHFGLQHLRTLEQKNYPNVTPIVIQQCNHILRKTNFTPSIMKMNKAYAALGTEPI